MIRGIAVMYPNRFVLTLAALLCVRIGTTVFAQDLTPARFSTLSTLQCVFTSGASGTWEGGTSAARPRSEILLRLGIEGIDAQDGTATIRDAPEVAAHAVAQFSGWTLHILQTDGAGGLNVTSVFARLSTGARLKAVHSRASYLPSGPASEPNVQQLYGDCEPGFHP